MTNARQQVNALDEKINITLAETTAAKGPPSSNFEGLMRVLEDANTPTLAATIARIVDIYPNVYTLALSGARCKESRFQEKLDALETIVGNLQEAFDDYEFDWDSYSKQMTAFFDELGGDTATVQAVIEYALGRVILFRNLCDRCHHDEIDKILSQLKAFHISSLERHEPDGAVLLELLTQWQIEYKSDFIATSLPEYSKFLDQEFLQKSRIKLEADWLKHFTGQSWCDHSDARCPKYRNIVSVIKTYGLSERLDSWLKEELEDYSDYYEAIELLRESGLESQSENTLKQAFQNLPNEDSADLLFDIANRMADNGDLAGAAEKMFAAFEKNPNQGAFQEFGDFIHGHLEDEWDSWLARIIEFLQEKLGKMENVSTNSDEFIELNSLLVNSLVVDEKIEEALERSKLGCKVQSWKYLMKVAKSLPYTAIRDACCLQLESELKAGSNASVQRAEELLLVMYRTVSGTEEKRDFHDYLKMLKTKFNLRGKSANILRKVGF